MEELDVNVSSREGFGTAEKILLLSFISAVILMAILGNLLVMVAVCRDRQLRKIKTNYFIVSLAFADLLVSVLVMPFGAMELVQDNWVYGEMFCLVRTSLDVLLTTASILHLCCISLDRYYAICCQPLVYRNKMTPLRIAVMLGGCWVIPTFISFLPIMQGWNSIGIIDLGEQLEVLKSLQRLLPDPLCLPTPRDTLMTPLYLNEPLAINQSINQSPPALAAPAPSGLGRTRRKVHGFTQWAPPGAREAPPPP